MLIKVCKFEIYLFVHVVKEKVLGYFVILGCSTYIF